MLLLLFFLFIQITNGRGISLFEYTNNTNNYNVQPFSPIVNTIKVAKEYEIEIYREHWRKHCMERTFPLSYSLFHNVLRINFPDAETFS